MFGAVFGSFVCCMARRMRAIEKGKKIESKTSVCLKCGYKLKWYDNIPIVSWVMLGGKCRKCKKKIGMMEIISEVALGLVFLGFGIFCAPEFSSGILQWAWFSLMLVLAVGMMFLALYDGKWGELPQAVLTFCLICAIMGAILRDRSLFSVVSFDNLEVIFEYLIGVGILGGIYFLLYVFSHGKMVGSGDWILGVIIAIALGKWWLALMVLVISNVAATIFMVPVAVKGKQKKIYFGPWMIGAFYAVMIFSEYLMLV